MTRKSLGFDIRVPMSKLSKSQTEVNIIRSSGMLGLGIKYILSADPAVWPRISFLEQYNEFNDFVNPAGLINNIETFVSIINNCAIDMDHSIGLCLTIEETTGQMLELLFPKGMLDLNISEQILIRYGWRRIGFDIVDLMGMISGLSGCEYKEKSRRIMESKFNNAINEYGLLKTCQAARLFSEARGLTIRDHAPFVVLGILVQNL
jgi:hypothetical protein